MLCALVDLKTYVKTYLKSIKEKLKAAGKSDEDVKTFETNAQNYVKRVVKDIKNLSVFCGKFVALLLTIIRVIL